VDTRPFVADQSAISPFLGGDQKSLQMLPAAKGGLFQTLSDKISHCFRQSRPGPKQKLIYKINTTCIKDVCVPDVLGALDVWRLKQNKKNTQ